MCFSVHYFDCHDNLSKGKWTRVYCLGKHFIINYWSTRFFYKELAIVISNCTPFLKNNKESPVPVAGEFLGTLRSMKWRPKTFTFHLFNFFILLFTSKKKKKSSQYNGNFRSAFFRFCFLVWVWLKTKLINSTPELILA